MQRMHSRYTATYLQVCPFIRFLQFDFDPRGKRIEWIGGDNNLQSNWSATDDGSVLYLQTQLTAPAPFQEVNDRPMDGIAYHAMLHVRLLPW